MSATNFTPIQLYRTTTASAVPTAGNLAAGELAINLTDEKLYFKNAGGTVKVLASSGTSSIGGSNTQVQYNNNGVLGGSSNFVFDGTNVAIGTAPAANIRLYVRTAAITDTAYYADNGSNSGFIVKFASSLTSIGNDFGSPLAFLTNNAERMRIDSSGNVGVGTTTPSAYGRLAVIGGNAAVSNDGATVLTLRSNANISELGAYAPTGASLVFKTAPSGGGETERMRIDSSGNVGIGTTSPATRLHINKASQTPGDVTPTGAVLITNTLAGAGCVEIGSGSPVLGYLQVRNTTSQTYYDFALQPNGGNVGIGTTSPAAKIHAFSASGSSALYLQNGTSTRTWKLDSFSDGNLYVGVPGVVDAMTFTPAGNVGIGTSSPSAKLTVYNSGSGDAACRVGNAQNANTTDVGKQGATGYGATSAGDGFLYSPSNLSIMSDGGVIKFSSGGNTERMRVFSSGDVGIGTGATSYAVSSDRTLTVAGSSFASLNLVCGGSFSGAGLTVDSSANLLFRNAGSERMRLDNAGNLGINVTPVNGYGRSIQFSSGASTTVGALLTQAINTNDQRVTLTNNALPPAGGFTGTFNYTLTGASATRYEQGGGAHTWFTAPTGTAGSAITFTQAMTLDSSGNVGIGTSSPSAKLDVNGSIIARTGGSVLTDTIAEYSGGGINLTIGTTGARDLIFRTNNVERARFDTAGNLLLGVTSYPGRADPNATADEAFVLDTKREIRWTSTNSSIYGGSGGGDDNLYYYTGLSHIWRSNSTERARIDSSGAFIVGTTNADPISAEVNGVAFNPTNGYSILANKVNSAAIAFGRTGNTGAIVDFYYGVAPTAVGSISTDGTNTAYNTSSDYRLKEIDGPIVNSGAYIDALKPVQGSWKSDGSRFIGLLAHEVQEVSETPIATGEKDGEEMQAMDYSAPELIANLIAEIQSLRARVAQLEGN